jgi:hypothetical protein
MYINMPFLTMKKIDGAKPIAVIRSESNSQMNGKFVYLCENENDDDNKDKDYEIEFNEFEKLIGKSGKTKDKIKSFDLISKALKKNLKPDDFIVDDENVKLAYKKISDNKNKIIKIPNDCHFEVMPKVPDNGGNNRECIYITGCSGSGKSWWIKFYVQNYNKLFKGKRPVYLVSTLEEDETLDNSDFKIQRLKLDSLVDDPIDLNTGELDNCCIIFDDFDTIEDEKGGRDYATKIWRLMDDILTKGRHHNITCIIASHYNTNGKRGRLILTECNKFVIYPHGTSAHAMKYLLNHHVGIDTETIKSLNHLGRWVCLSKVYPKYLISEHVVRLI